MRQPQSSQLLTSHPFPGKSWAMTNSLKALMAVTQTNCESFCVCRICLHKNTKLGSPTTPQDHQWNTLQKNMRLATLAPSMPPLHMSWHSIAAGVMCKWPGRSRKHERLYRTRNQDTFSMLSPTHKTTVKKFKEIQGINGFLWLWNWFKERFTHKYKKGWKFPL